MRTQRTHTPGRALMFSSAWYPVYDPASRDEGRVGQWRIQGGATGGHGPPPNDGQIFFSHLVIPITDRFFE